MRRGCLTKPSDAPPLHMPAYPRPMPETPEQLHTRALGALRTPPVQQWDTWPFEGEVSPKPLAPLTPEPAIHGQGEVDCRRCAKPDAEYRWTAERWRLAAL